MPEKFVAFKGEITDKRMVYGELYAPDRPDSDNEFMRVEEIEKMAHTFMRSMKLDSVDQQHDNVLVPGCCVVESFIARKGDPDFIEGSWVIGMHVDNDKAWEQIKKGAINGFSMEAMVIKDTQDVQMDIPPVLSGLTQKSEEHEHEFLVAYDPDGKFLGGKTSVVDDHFHFIKRGTVTEDANSHSHRFSHVEQLTIQPKKVSG